MKLKLACIAMLPLAAIATGGCSEVKDKVVEVRGVTYKFPRDHIDAILTPPEEILYVRLAPPGMNFHIVLDEFGHYLPNRQDKNIESIATLNNRFRQYEIIQSSIGSVVCGNMWPHFNCGFRLNEGEVRWSVLFDREYLGRVTEIKSHAEAVIQGYRRQDAHAG